MTPLDVSPTKSADTRLPRTVPELSQITALQHQTLIALSERAEQDDSATSAVEFLAASWASDIAKMIAHFQETDEAEAKEKVKSLETLKAELVWIVNLNDNLPRAKQINAK